MPRLFDEQDCRKMSMTWEDWEAHIFVFRRFAPSILDGQTHIKWAPSDAQLVAARKVLNKMPADIRPQCCKQVTKA